MQDSDFTLVLALPFDFTMPFVSLSFYHTVRRWTLKLLLLLPTRNNGGAAVGSPLDRMYQAGKTL